MPSFTVRPLSADDREWARALIAERWGADFVVVHGTVYRPHELAGFIAERGAEHTGLLTIHISGDACEIVTLDSLHPGAVDEARRLKPSIRLTGEHGIPIRDEIELELALGDG